MDIIFESSATNGKSTICLEYGTTVKDMIEKYCNENGLSINDHHIIFINNARRIYKNDSTKIESFFVINQKKPIVVVIDEKNVMGG